jgi:hypothetical protein
MKFNIAALCLAVMAAGSLQLPSMADEAWFTKYDHNHDGHWDYNEFKKAHYDWYKHHHEGPRLTEVELHKQWNTWDTDHHGWVAPETVRTYHHWD